MFSLKGNNVKLSSKPKTEEPSIRKELQSKCTPSKAPEGARGAKTRTSNPVKRAQSAYNIHPDKGTTIKAKALFSRRPTATSTLNSQVRDSSSSISAKLRKSQSEEVDFKNRTARRPFSFANDSYVPPPHGFSNEEEPNSLHFEIQEDPETELGAQSSARSIQSTLFGQTLIEIQDPLEEGEEEVAEDESIDKEPLQNGKTKPQIGDLDQLLITQSDNLVKDIVNLCDEMGLSTGDMLRDSQDPNNNPSNNFNQTEKRQIPICDLECPFSLVELSTSPQGHQEVTQTPLIPSKTIQELRKKSVNLIEFSPNGSIVPSRSVSAKNGRNSKKINGKVAEEDEEELYNKILGTLKLIEEEEEKGPPSVGHLIEYIKKRSPKSTSPERIPSRPPRPPSRTTSDKDLTQIRCTCPHPLAYSHSARSAPTLLGHQPQPQPYSSTPVTPMPLSGRSFQSSRENNSSLGPFSGRRAQEDSTPRFPKPEQNDLKGPSEENLWESSNEKTKNIFSYLDNVERADKEILFNIKFEGQYDSDSSSERRRMVNKTSRSDQLMSKKQPNQSTHVTLESLIRKGPVELAREIITLDRRVEEQAHNISILEETLLNQRELNMRNLKNAEKDLRKRLKIQQEEFEVALTRHQSFVDQLISEKRTLQEKFEKILKSSEDKEEKYQSSIKSLQEKHMEELKRIRKMHENSEKVKKQKWLGEKRDEMRELTVKGLEPEVQRIIQRHQKEMSEMRAWHSDEMKEVEEKWERKLNMQILQIKEQCEKEKEDLNRIEREQFNKKLGFELGQKEQEFEGVKKRILGDIEEERKKFAAADEKFQEILKESVRKAEIKGEVEVENLRAEYESKIGVLSRRHEHEIKSLKDVFVTEKEMALNGVLMKHEQEVVEKGVALTEKLKGEREVELKELEKKLRGELLKEKDEFEAGFEVKLKKMVKKYQNELKECEEIEKEIKLKFSHAKSELLAREEEIYTFRASLALKEKQIGELSESNMRMMEERANLTAIIRREFGAQMELLEDEGRILKGKIIELQSQIKFEGEAHQNELEKLKIGNEAELERVGARVKQALERKEEAMQELQKHLEKAQVRINHLEELLETQRKDFIQSIHKGGGGKGSRK